MTAPSVLTDSLDTANRVLHLLFDAATVRMSARTGIGWRVEFAISSSMYQAIGSDTLVLEEGCDERVRIVGKIGWTSADAEIERLMASSSGCPIVSINSDQAGKLEIRFADAFELRLLPANFSPDWQWIISPPRGHEASESLSIVSEQRGSIWTRYPQALTKYL